MTENNLAIIVEDDEALGFIMSMFLKELNKFDPIILCDKYEDITQYHLKGSFYLLDHDIKEGMSGSDFMQKHHLPKEKVILMSGRDSWRHYVDGGYAFLQKPFSKKDLYDKIEILKI
jgi:DNA-binding NtrC family response regulator